MLVLNYIGAHSEVIFFPSLQQRTCLQEMLSLEGSWSSQQGSHLTGSFVPDPALPTGHALCHTHQGPRSTWHWKPAAEQCCPRPGCLSADPSPPDTRRVDLSSSSQGLAWCKFLERPSRLVCHAMFYMTQDLNLLGLEQMQRH